MSREHIMPVDRVHYRWDNSIRPVLEIESGDVVIYDLREVSDGQITPAATAHDLPRLDLTRVYPLAGPIAVKGARPGDALEVEMLDLAAGSWGWSGINPGFGLLPEEATEPYLHIWDLSAGTAGDLRPGIRIPLDPFCGTIGVAPETPGSHPVMPPGPFGGNMDIRHLTQGATLFLPVWVDGALFSCGDPHAAQGDGEVCVSAIEAPMRARLRFRLRKGLSIPGPQFSVAGPLTPKHDRRGYYATTGIAPDLMEATRAATRAMLDHLVRSYGLSRQEAYILCSVAVDLKVSEVVDAPNWVVSAYLPLVLFG
jgi:acetamidase/formamidase